jgi:hypothetical protein
VAGDVGMLKKYTAWQKLIDKDYSPDELIKVIYLEKLQVFPEEEDRPVKGILDIWIKILIEHFRDRAQADIEELKDCCGDCALELEDILANKTPDNWNKLKAYLNTPVPVKANKPWVKIRGKVIDNFSKFKFLKDEIENLKEDNSPEELKTAAINPFSIADSRLRGKELKTKADICNYINISSKSIKTFNKFWKEENLPVYKYPGVKGKLYAYSGELDLWKKKQEISYIHLK